jgi:hypothetical protein
MDENPYQSPDAFQATKRSSPFWRSTGFVLAATLGWELALQIYRVNFADPGERLPDTFITDSSGRLIFSWNSYWEQPAVVWPAVALAAFFIWKTTSAVIDRRRRKTFSKSAAREVAN